MTETRDDIRREVTETSQELKGEVKVPAKKKGAKEKELTREDLQKAFYDNEYGDADLAVHLFRKRFARDNATGTFYRWNSHRWHQCKNREQEGEFRDLASLYSKEAAACMTESKALAAEEKTEESKKLIKWRDNFNNRCHALRGMARIRNILNLATAGEGSLGVTGDHWNQEKHLLPCANGVIDLETGKNRVGRWDDWFYAGSPIEYKGYHHAGDFIPGFLKQLMCGKEELIEYLEMLLGFACTGIQTKDFFVAYGPLGWNGKSVLFEWVARVLGEFAATIPVEMIYEDRFGRDPDKPSPQILRLRGLRFAIMTEPEGNKRLSPAKVKFLTSGTDKISGRNLNERQVIEFDPTHTLLMHGNTVPRVIGHQGPFYDRLRLLPFRARFIRDQGEVDPEKFVFLQIPEYQLTKTMHEHDSEMLSFLVRCARKALEAGDMPAPPEAVLKETADFRDEEDLVGRYLKQCTEIVPDGMEQAKDIYLSFAWWCKEELGLTAKSTPSQKAISSDLRAQPHIEREPGRVNKYRGIQVRKEWIPPKED